jgi:hypothetical protein
VERREPLEGCVLEASIVQMQALGTGDFLEKVFDPGVLRLSREDLAEIDSARRDGLR